MTQLSLLTLEKTTGIKNELCWISVDQLVPHPRNPRRGQPDKLEAIATSMKDEGYRMEKPMLVRPFESGYQIIGGHTRHQAAIMAGLEKVLCVVEEMDDETAILRIGQDNLNDPFSWFSQCIYVAQNSVKSSKTGHSRTTLITACTGKEGPAAKQEAMRKGEVGEFLLWLEEQGINVDTLLDPEVNLTSHIYAITKAPQQYRKQLFLLLVEQGWSVSKSETISNAMKELDIPENLTELFKPEECVKQICDDVVKSDSTRFAKDINNLVKAIQESIDGTEDKPGLSDRREVKLVDGDEFTVAYWNLREMYLERVLNAELPANPTPAFFRKIATSLLKEVQTKDTEFTTWEQQRLSNEEKKKLEERRQIWLAEMEERYSPTGHQGDVRDILPTLEHEFFDCILTDPPYLLSNGGITCRGNKQVSVDKNFEDSKETAISPQEWLELCYPLLKPGGVVVLTCTIHLLVEAMQALESVGFEFLHEYVWVKKSAPPRLTPTGPRACHEFVLVARKPGASHCYNYDLVKDKYHGGKQPSSVLEFEQCSGDERLNWHDTQKPLDLWTYLLDLFTNPYSSQILDPFSGSGTTAVACKQTARFCHWVEKDPDFFRLSLGRIQDVALPFKPEEMTFDEDEETEAEECNS
jgi:site-specific DNA-methyltransferase (adenine-specific)